MNTTRSTSHFLDLARGAVLRMRDAAGTRIVVRRGSAWITQEGDHRDIVLPCGGDFLLDRPGLAVVQMLGGGELRVDTPTPPASRGAPIHPLLARGRGLFRFVPGAAAAR